MEAHKEKFIRELTNKDTNVCVSGMVILKNPGSFVIDDGTGQMQINFDKEIKGDYVKVFGRSIPYESGIQVSALIVQDISKIDKVLYNKIKELVR
ncbi:MAG: hypothetical protein PHT54_01840 [Candidatus Nanoarchaeia archaeon]|nr:hypothetical protein [Candidatus Nanoarchaeia archaeon]